jgi:hypothetical protein
MAIRSRKGHSYKNALAKWKSHKAAQKRYAISRKRKGK